MAERKKVKKVSLSKQAVKKPTVSKTAPSTKKAKTMAPKTKPVSSKKNAAPKENTRPVTTLKRENKAPKKTSIRDIPMAPSKERDKNKSAFKNKTTTARTHFSKVSNSGRQNKNFSINWQILLGKKEEIRRKRISTALIVFPLILFLILFVTLTPTGPFEAITNSFARIGAGKFPKQIVGSQSISLKSEKNAVFLATDTHILGYTAAGKELYEYQHDFTSPVLETARTRNLVYNRNSTGFLVLNNSGAVMEKNLEKAILCGDIALDGTFAFATKSEKYSAQVDVYSKNFKHKFAWFLVDGLISDVELSNNGKYVAIAVLKAVNGSYSSEIYCFNVKSENPIYKITVEGQPVMALENISSKYFSYITNKAVCFVNWRKGEQKSFEEAGLVPAFYKAYRSNSLAVFGKNTSSTIRVIGKDGSEKARFSYNGLIDDVAISDNLVYILKGNKVFALDFEGKVIDTFSSEQSPHYIAASDSGVFVAENMSLTYFGR